MTTIGLVGIAASTHAETSMLGMAFIVVPSVLTQPASNDALPRVRAPQLRALPFGLVEASIPTASLLARLVIAVASCGTSWCGSVLAIVAMTLVSPLVPPLSPRRGGKRRRPTLSAVRRLGGPDLRDRIGGPPLTAALCATGCQASAAATSLSSTAYADHLVRTVPGVPPASAVVPSDTAGQACPACHVTDVHLEERLP